MQTYVISRPGVAASAAELDAALTRLRSFEDQPAALQARWMHSYALREADGRFGLSCVFEADSVDTLEQHAAQTRLPAREILAVAATVPVRAFAPTRVYLVRRRNHWRSAAELERSVATSRRVGDEDFAREVTWLHSYAVNEADGTVGTVCFYQAVNAQALREHALCAGIPLDEIVPVIGRIVFRDDPKPQPAHGSAVPA
jgi:hypothetical protein